jgi:hypothetical protein
MVAHGEPFRYSAKRPFKQGDERRASLNVYGPEWPKKTPGCSQVLSNVRDRLGGA